MAYKIHKGFTIIELLVAFIIFSILVTSFMYFVNGNTARGKASDQVRLKDMSLLDQAVNEYALDNNALPGVEGAVYSSAVLPGFQAGPLIDPAQGWIEADFSSYLQKLPIDPQNTDVYVYTYSYVGGTYEINSVLEVLTNGLDDGGNDSSVYEVGTNLSII